MNSHFIKIGHRGASGYEPENTLIAFERAIELGVDMIELDVHLCKSGELIVIHDESVDRTTTGSGEVAHLTLAELRKLNAGKGEQVPLLEEVISLVDKRCAINIEMKGRGTASPTVGLVEKAVREKGWPKEAFLLSSFSREELIVAGREDNQIRLGLNVSERDEDFTSFARELRLFSVHPGTDIVSREMIEHIHRLGLNVYVWTADDVDQIRWLRTIGVDGVFSNYPDRLVS